MRRLCYIILLLLPCKVAAQDFSVSDTLLSSKVEMPDTKEAASPQPAFRFAYISYGEVRQQMPAYKQARQQVEELKAKYEAEAERSEEEFQRKFTEFLEGQKDFPSNILIKRQAELQDIMERGMAFRKECEQLLRMAEDKLMLGVDRQLHAAINAVAAENGYAFVLNTDGNACPYINPLLGDNITDMVRLRLSITP
ncbi:MAG: OmpH family outer membrane protein [Bacteroidales bacterium]|nr:OmpH family outer membrane protein [Candidatus Physcousia equi]